MARRRPRIIEGHLLLGADHELDIRPGGVNYIIECPAAADLPEVIWIVDSDDEDVPIYISSDEEEEDVVEVPMEDEGQGIPPLDDEDELMEADEDEDTEDEDTDDSEDWLNSVKILDMAPSLRMKTMRT